MATTEFSRAASAAEISIARAVPIQECTVFQLLTRLRKEVSNVCAEIKQLRCGLVPPGVTAIYPLSDLRIQLGEAENDLRSGLAYLVPDEDHRDQVLPSAEVSHA